MEFKTKCLAPWNHTHVNVYGTRFLCCQSSALPESVQDKNFESFWNGETMKGIRLRFLQGEIPEEYCGACLGDSRYSEMPYMSFEVDQRHREELEKATLPDGKVITYPSILDYRFDNRCNLSCRTCDPQSSSVIEENLKKIKNLGTLGVHESKDVVKAEFRHHFLSGNCRKAYFAAGEPLFNKEYIDLFKEAVKKGVSQKIHLEFNTNLFHSYFTNPQILELLGQFESVDLVVSVDGSGQVAEFVRDGVEWNRFVRFYESVRSNTLFTKISLQITFTLPLLLEMGPMIRFLADSKPEYNIQNVYFGGYSTFLTPRILPSEIQNSLYSRGIKLLSEQNDDQYFGPFIIFLKRNLSNVSELDLNQKDELFDHYRNSKRLDEVSGRQSFFDFYKNFDETKNFFTHLENLLKQEDPKKEDFWSEILGTLKTSSCEVIQFPNENELLEKVNSLSSGQEISFLLSRPSLLSLMLSRENEKFKTYLSLETLRNVDITRRAITPFLFLSVKNKFLSNFFIKAEPIMRLLFSWLGFHSFVVIKKK